MKTIKLNSIATAISISVPSPSQSGYDRFIGLEHYDSGEPVITRFQGTELLTTAAKEFKANDILVARRNVYLKRAGIVFFDGITSGDSIILRIKEDTESTLGYSREDLIRYIPLVLNSEHFWIYANKHADGMNSKRISKDTLLEYEFVLPTINEMREMSDKIWAAYRLKEAYKRLLTATDEMVKSQFLEMCSDIVSRKALSELLSENFPGEWGSEPTDYDRTKVIRTTNFTNEGKLDLTDVVERSIDAKKVAKKQLKKGDIILERSGGTKENPVGRVVIFEEDGKYLFNNFTQLLRPNENVNSTYLFYYLFTSYNVNKASMRAMASQTTGIQNLNMSDYLAKTIELPSNNVQNHFETIYRQADKSKFELRKAIDAIDEVIKSLING